MILTKAKFYGASVLAIIFAAGTAVQSWRLHSTETDLAKAEATLAQERAVSAANLAQAQQDLRTAEAKLTASATRARKEKHEAVRSLTNQRDILLDRLRIAEANARAGVSGATPNSGDGQATGDDNGAELPGSIGEEDVREATRADEIRLNLLACYKQYEEVRKALAKRDQNED